MFNALGFSQTEFLVSKAGRLCRGRERWIDPWTEESTEVLHRLVISGAALNDDSAARAFRGVQQSGISVARVLHSLYSGRVLLAFMEDGHPADIPENGHDVELYEGHRSAGRTEEIFVRWTAEVDDEAGLQSLVGDDPVNPGVRGFLPMETNQNIDTLKEGLFFLTGLSCIDSPPAQFQPEAFSELLTQAESVILLHRDKHGPAIGIYSRERLEVEPILRALTDEAGVLLVPFAIPPMLARWDRALSELRAGWDEAQQGVFPIPVAPEGGRWDDRRRRRSDKSVIQKESGSDAAEEGSLSADDELLLSADDDVLFLVADDVLGTEE